MQNLLTKYNNLKQEAWSHCVTFSTIFVCLPSIWLCNLLFGNSPGFTGNVSDLALFPIYVLLNIGTYITIPLLMVLNLFQKIKITNKFLTTNKIYGILWHISNLIFFIIYPIFICKLLHQ